MWQVERHCFEEFVEHAVFVSPCLSLFDRRQLDVSFNILRKVEGLEQLTRLKKLFLLHNKIGSIANLDHFTCLEMLELGSNRIRV